MNNKIVVAFILSFFLLRLPGKSYDEASDISSHSPYESFSKLRERENYSNESSSPYESFSKLPKNEDGFNDYYNAPYYYDYYYRYPFYYSVLTSPYYFYYAQPQREQRTHQQHRDEGSQKEYRETKRPHQERSKRSARRMHEEKRHHEWDREYGRDNERER